MVNGMVNFTLYRSDTLATPTATIRTRYVLSVQERGGQIYEEKKRDHDIFYYHISGTPNPKPDEAATHGYGKKRKRNEKTKKVTKKIFVPIFFSSNLSIVPPLTKPSPGATEIVWDKEKTSASHFHFGSLFFSI